MTTYISETYKVYAGETVSLAGSSGFQLDRAYGISQATMTIAGTVNVSQSADYSSVVGLLGGTNFSTVTIEATGKLNVAAAGRGTAHGISTNSYPAIVNAGSITVTGGSAYGVTTYGSSFENSGSITATATDSFVRGVEFTGSGALRNTGAIEVAGREIVQAVYAYGSGPVAFFNSGSIKAGPGGAQYPSIGVFWNVAFVDWPRGATSFLNDGWIQGDYALKVGTSGYTSYVPEVFTNCGTMMGRVDLGERDGRLVNSGVIWGDVALGLGADSYDGRLGQFRGAMDGGDGADTLLGGAWAETLGGGVGADSIDGGAGDDVIGGGRDGDVLIGGDGFDTVSFTEATMSVTLSFATGRATSSGEDTISGFEAAWGGALNDTLIGATGADSLAGNGGDDALYGAEANDTLDGGAGRNFLRGNLGDDIIHGGADFDDAHGNEGNDSVYGGAGDDWVVGGKDQDQLYGEAGGDIVLGNLGDDTCEGGAGDDIVRGGQGNDIVRGDAGDDWLAGDRGDDTLTGGAGADTFHSFAEAGLDRILDFNIAEGDRLNLLPGSSYAVAQVGADTVVSIVGGAQVVLVGVSLTSLPEGWIWVG